jgi:hypothetical protein
MEFCGRGDHVLEVSLGGFAGTAKRYLTFSSRTFLLQPGRDPGKFCFGSLSSVAFGGLQCRTMKP